MQPENSLENSSFHQFMAMQSLCRSSPFYATGGVDHQLLDFNDKSEARAFAASENHKEAERKRRERINAHLDSLRALLLCNSKTDKASLLAKVVQRVRELKQQTSQIMHSDQTFPSETDEVAVVLLQNDEDQSTFNGTSTVVKASLCCEDRIDLIPDLIEILKPLPLRPLRAEIATLGGRIRNVIVLAGDKNQTDESVLLMLKDSLKTLILRSSNYGAGERSKRRRMFDQGIMRQL